MQIQDYDQLFIECHSVNLKLVQQQVSDGRGSLLKNAAEHFWVPGCSLYQGMSGRDRRMCQFKHTCWYGSCVWVSWAHIWVYTYLVQVSLYEFGLDLKVPGPVLPNSTQNLPQHSEHSTPSLQLLSFLRTSSGATNRHHQSRSREPTLQKLPRLVITVNRLQIECRPKVIVPQKGP